VAGNRDESPPGGGHLAPESGGEKSRWEKQTRKGGKKVVWASVSFSVWGGLVKEEWKRRKKGKGPLEHMTQTRRPNVSTQKRGECRTLRICKKT